jgi:beta propeller repeat protein
MKRGRIRGLMAAVLLTASLWGGTSAFAANEIRVDASQPYIARTGFDISTDYAVWMVKGENTITLYDIDDQSESKIGNKSSGKKSPVVDGKYVAWIDDRHGGDDVYLYDIDREKEIRITDGDAKPSELDIADNMIVWADSSDGNIYLYDIEAGTEKRVSTSGRASNPTVTGSYVAWEDTRNKNSDIFYYDISKGREYPAVEESGNQTNPSIYDDQIVYESDSGRDTDIYLHELGSSRDKQLTTDSADEVMPQIYEDDFIYYNEEEEALYFGSVNRPKNAKEIAKGVSKRLQPRMAGDYVIFAKKDRDDNLSIYIYDTDDEDLVQIGGTSGEPTQPDGDDRYVVYINESKRSSSVVLYDLQKKTSKVISKPDSEPSRPLVSSPYVVWYDEDEETLMVYNIRTGKLERAIDQDDTPHDSLYELEGNNLLWVNEGRRYDVILTDLSSGDYEELETLNDEPLYLDVNEDYAMWVKEERSGDSTIVLYDIDRGRDEDIRTDVEIKGASLGDEFVVWSEYSNSTRSYDLYYYDIDRERTNLAVRWTERDQIEPQASRDVVFFSDNRNSKRDTDYYFELYDIDRDSYMNEIWSEDAEIEEPRMGGNRLVWIDNRDSTPAVYTAEFASPRDDDDDDDNGGEIPGDYTDYNFIKVMTGSDDSVIKIIAKNANRTYFVLDPGTSKEKSIPFMTALDDVNTFFKLLNGTNINSVVIRVFNK